MLVKSSKSLSSLRKPILSFCRAKSCPSAGLILHIRTSKGGYQSSHTRANEISVYNINSMLYKRKSTFKP